MQCGRSTSATLISKTTAAIELLYMLSQVLDSETIHNLFRKRMRYSIASLCEYCRFLSEGCLQARKFANSVSRERETTSADPDECPSARVVPRHFLLIFCYASPSLSARTANPRNAGTRAPMLYLLFLKGWAARVRFSRGIPSPDGEDSIGEASVMSLWRFQNLSRCLSMPRLCTRQSVPGSKSHVCGYRHKSLGTFQESRCGFPRAGRDKRPGSS